MNFTTKTTITIITYCEHTGYTWTIDSIGRVTPIKNNKEFPNYKAREEYISNAREEIKEELQRVTIPSPTIYMLQFRCDEMYSHDDLETLAVGTDIDKLKSKAFETIYAKGMYDEKWEVFQDTHVLTWSDPGYGNYSFIISPVEVI